MRIRIVIFILTAVIVAKPTAKIARYAIRQIATRIVLRRALKDYYRGQAAMTYLGVLRMMNWPPGELLSEIHAMAHKLPSRLKKVIPQHEADLAAFFEELQVYNPLAIRDAAGSA